MAYTFKHGDRPLDGITVQRAVGRGGFGEVYYALTDSGKQVAVKYLRDNPEIELRGISHVMNLKSPHLITIYDVRKNASGDPFVIMEYVSGPSLRELMTAEPGGMSVAKAAFLFTGICKGLSYLHERGIVHRDLKPANIFYDDGYVKIGDYGLSKHMSVSQHSGQTVSVGTVHYMAPEIGSGSYTKAIDIYAVGVILYEMLTGRLPFSGSSMAEILMKHVREQPNLMGVPQPFAQVIAKALAKDPQDRYQDANEMLAAVMEHASFSEDAASFDASQLTAARRHEAHEDDDRTVTSPSPRPVPPPPMDARMAGDVLATLPDRLQKKLERLGRKLERKAAKLERKSGRWRKEVSPGAPPAPGAQPSPAYSDITVTRGSRFAQLIVIALVAIVANGALEFFYGRGNGGYHGEPLMTISLVLALAGALTGVMLAHFQVLTRLVTRSEMLDRVVYTSAAGVCMLPALGPGLEVHREFGSVLVGPLACLLICNWNERIDAARRGMNEGWGWAMLWPALVGFITVQILDAHQFKFVSAGLCALFAALTPTTAAMWPYPRRPTTPIDGAAPPPDDPMARPPSPAAVARRWSVPSPAAPAQAAEVRGGEEAPWRLPAGAILVQPVARHPLLRTIFWLLSIAAFLVSASTFAALALVSPGDHDVQAVLLSVTLVALACQPFLLWKALQRYKRPLWYGTLRPLLLTMVVLAFIALGMIAAFSDLHGDDWVPFLIIASLAFSAGIAVLFLPGRRWREKDVRGTSASPEANWPAPAPPGEAIVIDARGQRSASIGVAFVTIALLLAASTALFNLWSSERAYHLQSRQAAVLEAVAIARERAAESARGVVAPSPPEAPLVDTGPGPRKLPGPAQTPGPNGGHMRPAPEVRELLPPELPGLNRLHELLNPDGSSPRTGKRVSLLVMGPLALGAGFLLWSRRGQGWGPALRTLGGCGLLFALAVTLTTGGAFGGGAALTSDTFGPVTLERGVRWGELAKIAGFAAGALTLLMWPRSARGARAGF